MEYISIVDKFWSVINGQFLAAFFSTLSGAYAAYHLERKTRQKEEILKEVRNINATIMITFNIFISYIRLNRQIIKPTVSDYRKFCDALSNATQQNPCELPADFQRIDYIDLPIDLLKTQVFEKISTDGEIVNYMIYLNEATEKLKSSIQQRNQWIEERRQFSVNKHIDPDGYIRTMKEYAAHQIHDGMIDYSYKGFIDNMEVEIRDCIWFSKKLAETLNHYGERKIKKHKNLKLKINKIDFSKSGEEVPKDDDYKSITDMYKINYI